MTLYHPFTGERKLHEYELKVQEAPQFVKDEILPYFSFGHHNPVTFLKAVHDYRIKRGHLEYEELTEAVVRHSVATERIDMGGNAIIEFGKGPVSVWITYIEGPSSSAI